MARQDHQRYEFVFHKKRDKQLIAFIGAVLYNGYSLADYVRDLIEREMNPPPEVVQVAAPSQPGVSDEQRAFYAELLTRIERPAQTQAPSQREVHSGGLDMRERPRKANHPKAEPGTDTQH